MFDNFYLINVKIKNTSKHNLLESKITKQNKVLLNKVFT